MTRYSVVWVQSAQDELANLRLSASDRNLVTAATDAIAEALRENARDRGIELSEGLRCLFAPPLKVIFVVREQDRITEVLRVRRI